MPNPTRSSYLPSQLSAGDFPIVMDTGLIAAGQKLTRGAVLGQITANHEYVLCKAAAEDGSQAPARSSTRTSIPPRVPRALRSA